MRSTARLALAFLVTTSLIGVASAAERPNVIVIMADDVGQECFGSYGSEQYATPRLDELASKGVRFTEAHSQPLCTPSRIKLMSGRTNAENYVAFSILDPGVKTIGQYFQDAGYKTAIAGKWQLLGSKDYKEPFPFRGSWPEHCGFDSHCLWQVDKRGLRFWNPLLRIDGDDKQFEETDYGPTIVNQHILDFITANKEQPFFVYYPMILVHNPFLPTPDSDPSRNRSREKGNRQANFEDMVSYMDKMVGRLADHLESLGLAENTLVLFMGDNGTNKAIKSQLDGQTIVGGKGLTKNRGTHVPLIASWPGTAKAGHVVEDLIDFTDILPTSLDAAGAAVPDAAEGVSFLPQVRGEKGSPREFAYCFYWPRPERGEPSRFVHDGRWKLYTNGNLFDTDTDSEEKQPLKGKQKVRKRLQAALDSVQLEGQKILDFAEKRPQP